MGDPVLSGMSPVLSEPRFLYLTKGLNVSILKLVVMFHCPLIKSGVVNIKGWESDS